MQLLLSPQDDPSCGFKLWTGLVQASCQAKPGQVKGRGCSWARAGAWGQLEDMESLTYVHTLLLRTSGGPHCNRSRGPGVGHRWQPLCSCPRAAGHISYSIHSHL